MPTRKSTTALAPDETKIAQLLAAAWTSAEAVERRYPRVFAKAFAKALQLNKDAGEAFVNAMAGEVEAIEQARRRDGFGAS